MGIFRRLLNTCASKAGFLARIGNTIYPLAPALVFYPRSPRFGDRSLLLLAALVCAVGGSQSGGEQCNSKYSLVAFDHMTSAMPSTDSSMSPECTFPGKRPYFDGGIQRTPSF